MSTLSIKAKEAIVQKVLSKPNYSTIKSIAEAHNVSYSALKRWVTCYRDDMMKNKSTNGDGSQTLSLSDRFNHLMTTASMDESKIGIYCREHGLFSFQLKQWKEEFMKPPMNAKNQIYQSELKALRQENKKLKHEIRRKNSALAETTALLVLKKKASLIWGEIEAD